MVVSLTYLYMCLYVRQRGILNCGEDFLLYNTILPSNFSAFLDSTNVLIFKSDISQKVLIWSIRWYQLHVYISVRLSLEAETFLKHDQENAYILSNFWGNLSRKCYNLKTKEDKYKM